jgi:hypothetical protein
VESVFTQVTVVPVATSSSSGAYALFPSASAPTGIVTDDDNPTGVGDGAGAGAGDGDGVIGDESLPPQAIADIRNADTTTRRNDNITTLHTIT